MFLAYAGSVLTSEQRLGTKGKRIFDAIGDGMTVFPTIFVILVIEMNARKGDKKRQERGQKRDTQLRKDT